MERTRIRIGRADTNDIVLKAKSVSRFHGEIVFENGQYVLKDNDSTNGIIVDHERVREKPLVNGCEFHLGDEKLKYSCQEMDVSQDHRISLLNRSSAFNELDQDTKLELTRRMSAHFYPKGSFVLNQNAPLECIYFVVTGQLNFVEINEEGGERLIQELMPGQIFGEQSLLPGQTLPWHIIAAEPSWILELRQEEIEEFARNRPDLDSTVVKTVQKYLSTGTHETEDRGLPVPAGKIEKSELVGKNRNFLAAVEKTSEIFADGRTPLIVGPPGTGKKLLAWHCHNADTAGRESCIELSLAELDPLTVEGALFGVEPDPKVTHIKARKGYLEILEGGTLIISHTELLSPHLQSKLLTYLKLGWFHKQYGQTAVTSRTRVILLMTGDLSAAMGHLIRELQLELENQTVALPPLSKRLKDIPELAEHFLARYAKRAAKEASELSREAREKLLTYAWPGNVAELENVIQRAVCVSADKTIIPGDLIFVTPREKDQHKINILRHDKLRDFLRSPLLFRIFMWFNIFMAGSVAVITIIGGLHAPDHPLRHMDGNPGMLLTWLVWFPLLPISALLLGRIWCGICPIAGIGDLFSRLFKLNLPVPKIFRRLDFWLLLASFLFLDFIEEFIEVSHEPLSTGLLLVAIVLASVAFCILYERKTFCRYVCPLAGLLGAYATVSPVEVRGNRKVCQTQCSDQSCYKGSGDSPGCPLFSYPASLNSNAECMMCGNCLRNCQNRGVQVNLRLPMQELWQRMQPILSISIFGVILIGLMGRHQFSELPTWQSIEAGLSLSPNGSYVLLYFTFILLALLPFSVGSTLSAAASNEKIARNMATYGLAFIPLALAGHIAHVSHELLREGLYELIAYALKIWNHIFGGSPPAPSDIVVPHFIHGQVVTLVKFMIIFCGFTASIVALVMIARQVSRQNVYGRSLPHLLTVFIFGAAYFLIFLS